MDITGLVIILAIGAVAGWLAGVLIKGGGFGLLGNIVVGIIGAIVGGGCIWFAWHLCGRGNWFNSYSNRWSHLITIHCRPYYKGIAT